MYYPIKYYYDKNIYAYYRSEKHIIFDENLSYLLKNKIYPVKVNNKKIIFR